MQFPSAPQIRSTDMLFLDDVFDMGGGYVLDFSDRTFAIFFAEELNIDIDDPVYARNGSSKAKRLRCFLQTANKAVVLQALKALWEYREAVRIRTRKPETVENAEGRLLQLINKLSGHAPAGQPSHTPPPATDKPKFAALKTDLLALAQLTPQARGYGYETFLKKLFNAFGMAAREPFSLRGEQIDGSFQLENEIYLVEAKWHAQRIGVAELHTFQGKLEQKAAWTRGLFVSDSGFTDEGLAAFGRGKRIICMDGLDIFECLERELPLNVVLSAKVRRAAETGAPFVRVRDIFTK
ncbi:restriction endonuclease [Roseateles microcysteis]|uniref:restriction endonuclease n=1 Tax=Roseateles microcysteis TaxID=3119057 RepID=UPI002FE6419C